MEFGEDPWHVPSTWLLPLTSQLAAAHAQDHQQHGDKGQQQEAQGLCEHQAVHLHLQENPGQAPPAEWQQECGANSRALLGAPGPQSWLG